MGTALVGKWQKIWEKNERYSKEKDKYYIKK